MYHYNINKNDAKYYTHDHEMFTLKYGIFSINFEIKVIS